MEDAHGSKGDLRVRYIARSMRASVQTQGQALTNEGKRGTLRVYEEFSISYPARYKVPSATDKEWKCVCLHHHHYSQSFLSQHAMQNETGHVWYFWSCGLEHTAPVIDNDE
jgi:hypothetical protein